LLSSVVVYANTVYPELNLGFEGVYTIKDIDGNDKKSHFYGFTIVQEVDYRWVHDHDESSDNQDPFKCRIKSPNTLEFTMPGPSYSLTKDRARFEDLMDTCTLDGLDDDAHKLAEDASGGSNKRKTKKILLVFPNWVQLTAKEIYEHEVWEDKNELIPVTIPVPHRDQSRGGATNCKYFSYWTVARKDVRSYKKGKVEPKKNKSRMKQSLVVPSTPPRPSGRGQMGGQQMGAQQAQQMAAQQQAQQMAAQQQAQQMAAQQQAQQMAAQQMAAQQMGGGSPLFYAAPVTSNQGLHQDPNFGPAPGAQDMEDEDPFGAFDADDE
jgi:hypothetical protein